MLGRLFSALNELGAGTVFDEVFPLDAHPLTQEMKPIALLKKTSVST